LFEKELKSPVSSYTNLLYSDQILMIQVYFQATNTGYHFPDPEGNKYNRPGNNKRFQVH
jgi:hypothetical protein